MEEMKSMYKNDKYGEYAILDKWVRAWTGGGHCIAGFAICELREYADGKKRVHSNCPIYIEEHPEFAFAHSIYLRTQAELGV